MPFQKGHKINKGRKQTEHTKARLCVVNLNNTYHSGKVHTEATKKLLSTKNTGYKHTEVSLNKMKGRKVSKETLEKMKNVCKGEKNYRWIKDRTKLKTDRRKSYDTQYKQWAIAVKNRDNWKCKILNKDCKGRLESHHILNWVDHLELRYGINNGITLCHFHHPKVRKEEKRLSPYFMELVSVSNK